MNLKRNGINKKRKKVNMKFNISKKMREYIQSGRDIYSPSLEIYMFLYNEEGAICQYSIRQDEAKELNEKDEYWGAYLGTGGIIYDDPVDDLFNDKCKTVDWEDVTK